MAFLCTLTDSLEISCTFGPCSSGVAITTIGRDDTKDVSYAMVAGLDVVPGDMEFWFHIVATNTKTGQETPYWNGKEIAQVIPKEDKPRVLGALMAVTRTLFEGANSTPESFFMCTYDPDLPEKALGKHERVCEVFQLLGYVVIRMDPYHGKHLWRMER